MADIPLEGDIEVQIKGFEDNGTGTIRGVNVTDNNRLESRAEVTQYILLSDNNTSGDQLASGATFTGTAEETYGINGIQVFTTSDQDMTVYVDQGLDGSTYEITDEYPVYANKADSRVFTSVAPFFRIRVTNNGGSTTTSFFQATAMTPFINPLPRALSEQGGLRTTTDQFVKASEANNSTSNLAHGASFTGTAESTLGVAGLQVNFKADQYCLIELQQSNEGTNWDIVDRWHVDAGEGDSRTVQATASYFRTVVTNESLDGTSATTYLRLQSVLCPIVEAVPRALTESGAMKMSITDPHNQQYHAHCDGDYKLLINDGGETILRSQFTDSIDEGEWTVYTSGTATANVNGTLVLDAVNTTAFNNAAFNSKLVYTPSTGLLIKFTTIVAFDEPTATNNSRTWGMINVERTDGIYFHLDSGTLYATTLKDGTPTQVNVDNYKPTDGLHHSYEINFSGTSAIFVIDRQIVYSTGEEIGGAAEPLIASNKIKAGASNTNTGTASVATTLSVYSMSLITPYARSTNLRDSRGYTGTISPDGYLWTQGSGTTKFIDLFEDDSIDTTNRWTETIAGSASKTVSDVTLSMTVTTGATDSIAYHSKQELPFSTGNGFSVITFTINLGLVDDEDNVREWGSYDGDVGVFWRWTDGELYLVLDNDGSEAETLVPFINDGKPHIFSILRKKDEAFYGEIDGANVGANFSGFTSLAPSHKDVPYMANYNTGTISSSITMKVSGVVVVDPTGQSTSIQGLDDTGLIRPVAVNSQGELLVAPAKVSAADVVNQYDGWDNSNPKISYTVPTGKVLRITSWAIAARSDATGHTFALRFGSTEFSWISVNNDGTTTIQRNWNESSPFSVAAGVVVSVNRIDGSEPEEWSVEVNGYLEDA